MRSLRTQICLLFLSCLLGLTACGTSPDRGRPAAGPPAAGPQDLVAEANRNYEGQRYLVASELYLQAAGDTSGQTRNSLLVRSAEAAWRADRAPLARRTLKQVDDDELSPRVRLQADLLRAETGVFKDDPDEVLDRLPVPQHGERPEIAARILTQRSAAWFRKKEAVEATRALVMKEAWLQDSTALAQNRVDIWKALRISPHISDEYLYRLDLDPITRGWLELAILDRAAWRSARDRERGLDEWQNSYPGHPASGRILASVAEQPLNGGARPGGQTGASPVPPGFPGATGQTGDGSPPVVDLPPGQQTIALLLPLTGPFSSPARAVRDGFLAAHLARSDAPRVIVLDIAQADDPRTVYQQARQLGATTIVGPLQKSRVGFLSRISQGDIPILALNYLEPGVISPPGFYQFGLAPEDEAREAARRMIADGLQVASLLAPDEDWANRSLRAFQEQFLSLGGRIAAYRVYESDTRDFSSVVSGLLNESGHIPRRMGEEADAPTFGVFLVAKPQQGRLIRPQFLYHGASRVSLYSTSHIYSGQTDKVRDADLEGIKFVDTDWSLDRSPEIIAVKNRVRTLYPRTFNQFSRLYAFGYDAARLQPYVSKNRLEPGNYYSAASGVLFLTTEGRIGRRLSWAEFRNGRAQFIDTGTSR